LRKEEEKEETVVREGEGGVIYVNKESFSDFK
jgi:hypothetical protein